jgi:chemotaxis protein CheD
VIFEPNTGRAFVKKIDKLYNDTITRRETDYGQRIENDPVDGEIELF